MKKRKPKLYTDLGSVGIGAGRPEIAYYIIGNARKSVKSSV